MISLPVPPSLSGVYHIIRDGEVIYIGQTVNIFSRISTWSSGKFKREHFDRVDFHPLPLEELSRVEEEHIGRFRPRLNVEGVSRPYRAPKRLSDAPRWWCERRSVLAAMKLEQAAVSELEAVPDRLREREQAA